MLIVLRECHTPKQGHDLAVDIWAIGMLTLQLYAGAQELPESRHMILGSQEDVDEHVEAILRLIHRSREIPASSETFVHGCLVYNSEKRLTVREALGHDWLQKPDADRKLFRRREMESISHWSPRGSMLPVIEDLKVEARTFERATKDVMPTITNTVSLHFKIQKQASHLPEPDASTDGAIHTEHTENESQGPENKPRREYRELSPKSLHLGKKRMTCGKQMSLFQAAGNSKRRRIHSL